METKWQERPLRFTQHASLRLWSSCYVFKTRCQVKNSSTFSHGVLFMNQRTRPVWTASHIPFFPSAPPTTTINTKQTTQSYMQRSLSSCWAGIEWSRHVPDSDIRAWAFPARRRAPRAAPNGSRVQKLVGLQHRLLGLSLNCIFSESPRTPQCSHSSSFSLYPSLAEWVSERASDWAQLKATGDALCVRARARTTRRASPHLSPLIIWSNLRKTKTLWLQIYGI